MSFVLSFADVMSFFISVYLLIGVSEKCQSILFLLLKRREKEDFHRFGIPSYFSFLKQSFIAPPPIQSFQKFASITESFILYFFCVIFGVILCFLSVISLTLSIILCLLGVILNFLSTILSFCPPFLSTIFII